MKIVMEPEAFSKTSRSSSTRISWPRKRTVNYSKLKVYGALSSIGKWDAFEDWLKSEELDGMNAWTAFSLAQDLAAEDERFDHYCQRACEALGITEEQKAALLEACEL